MDPPDMLVEGALQNHYKMIKQMKGAWDIKITTYLKILKLCAITEPLLKYFSLFMNFLLVFGPIFHSGVFSQIFQISTFIIFMSKSLIVFRF